MVGYFDKNKKKQFTSTSFKCANFTIGSITHLAKVARGFQTFELKEAKAI
jgi:hypothetical protein